MDTDDIQPETVVRKNLFLNPDLLQMVDGKLYTEDGFVFHVHKIQLAKNSKYFYDLFCDDETRGKPDFLVPGIRGEVMEIILSFLYLGSIQMKDSNVREVIIAADYLSLDTLLKYIETVYARDSLSVSNCLPVFIAASKVNRKEIMCLSFRFIQTHFEAVVSVCDSEFGKLPFQALKRFLGNKNLRVTHENTVWMAIRKWVQTDVANRQSLVPNLLMYVTTSNVDEQLAEKILQDDVVACNPFCNEIHSLKQNFDCNLDVLHNYIQKHPNPILTAFNCRLPDHVYFIVNRQVRTPRNTDYAIFTTYDDNLDLWRPVVEVTFRPKFIACLGHSVYIFSEYMDDETQPASGIRRFNVIGRMWGTMAQFVAHRDMESYSVVQLGGLIYVLGGMSNESGDLKGDVEVYDPDEDSWRNLAPMLPAWSSKAAALGKIIYVVGKTGPQSYSVDQELAMQAYDTESDVWTVVKKPSISRFEYAFIAHRGRIYIIGGRNKDEYLTSVEVFDPENNEWTTQKDLPSAFYVPKAIVFNDELIVYESENRYCTSYFETNSAMQWDQDLKCWNIFKDPSPMNVLFKYRFFAQEIRGLLNGILIENKNPETKFLKSPFN